jgi:hypothetical protein
LSQAVATSATIITGTPMTIGNTWIVAPAII